MILNLITTLASTSLDHFSKRILICEEENEDNGLYIWVLGSEMKPWVCIQQRYSDMFSEWKGLTIRTILEQGEIGWTE